MKTFPILLLLLAALFTYSGCQKGDEPPACEFQAETGSRFFEFEHSSSGKTFVAWTTDTAVVNDVLQQLALPEAERKQHINGPIARNPEGCQLNGPWSWYFVPDEWILADLSVEVCDGNPDFVEENLDEYIRIGHYCPWSSFVKREVEQPF